MISGLDFAKVIRSLEIVEAIALYEVNSIHIGLLIISSLSAIICSTVLLVVGDGPTTGVSGSGSGEVIGVGLGVGSGETIQS